MNLASVSYWEYISVHKGPGELLFVVTVSVSFQDSRVLVLGDSHVRRLAEREYLINDHLQGVLLTWRFLPDSSANARRERSRQRVLRVPVSR